MKRGALFLMVVWMASAWSGEAEEMRRASPRGEAVASKTDSAPQPPDLRLVSPYGAVLRSLVLPGWGQMHIRERVQGLAFLVGVSGLATAWVVTHRDFRHQYNDVYLPEVKRSGVSSPEAEAIYREVNRRYKTSRFLLFTTLGVWGYSLIDAYVDANIYNAEIRAEEVIEESNKIRKLQVGWHRGMPFLSYHLAF